MRSSDLKDYAMIGALFGAGYLLYKFVQGGANLVTSAGQAVTSVPGKVADIAETLFPHQTTVQVPSGTTVILSTGEEIPWASVKGVGLFTDVDGTQKQQFFYSGHTWRTTAAQPDETGTYYATLWV